jgi:hypothetical protein
MVENNKINFDDIDNVVVNTNRNINSLKNDKIYVFILNLRKYDVRKLFNEFINDYENITLLNKFDKDVIVDFLIYHYTHRNPYVTSDSITFHVKFIGIDEYISDETITTINNESHLGIMFGWDDIKEYERNKTSIKMGDLYDFVYN